MGIQIAGERQCRKIFSGNLPFSLPISYWVHKKWACTALARVAVGRCTNIRNAHWKVCFLTYEDCKAGIIECKNWLCTLSATAKGLRKVHLQNCLINAEDTEDPMKLIEIKWVIVCEEQGSTWRAIKKVVQDPRLGAITKVDKVGNDGHMWLSFRQSVSNRHVWMST